MAVIYPMAEKIYKAQKEALKNGDSLKIYEAFRPSYIQKKIVSNLKKLADNDKEIMKGINTKPWGINWFIATTVSNHQRGSAIDVSLVKIKTYKNTDNYIKVINYEEYKMPTAIHELSINSIVFKEPVSSKSKDLWKKSTLTKTMTEGAKRLQYYCTQAGMTPLASEWWHFNDLDSVNIAITGNFYLNEILSFSL